MAQCYCPLCARERGVDDEEWLAAWGDEGQARRDWWEKIEAACSGVTSARQLFTIRTKPHISAWRKWEKKEEEEEPPNPIDVPTSSQHEKFSDVCLRMCSDERMHVAWEALAGVPHKEFERFLNKVQIAQTSDYGWRFLATRQKEWLDKIREIKQTIHALKQSCNTIIDDDCVNGLFDTLASKVPGLPDQLNAALAVLSDSERKSAERLHNIVPYLPRKPLAGRTMFVWLVGTEIRRLLQKPHYEVVAAITNVVYDTGDNNSVSAEAVRKIDIRKPDDLRP
jgi:hypothetical protein